MKLIGNIYKHKDNGFEVEVTTCNKRIATTKNIDTDEIVKFNRPKFEWMINKGIFSLIGEAV